MRLTVPNRKYQRTQLLCNRSSNTSFRRPHASARLCRARLSKLRHRSLQGSVHVVVAASLPSLARQKPISIYRSIHNCLRSPDPSSRRPSNSLALNSKQYKKAKKAKKNKTRRIYRSLDRPRAASNKKHIAHTHTQARHLYYPAPSVNKVKCLPPSSFCPVHFPIFRSFSKRQYKLWPETREWHPTQIPPHPPHPIRLPQKSPS